MKPQLGNGAGDRDEDVSGLGSDSLSLLTQIPSRPGLQGPSPALPLGS